MVREADLKILKSIGLSKTESMIYIDLVKHPLSGVTDISKRTLIHRPNIYDAVTMLKEKGLIHDVINGEGKTLKALEPDAFRLYLKQKESEIDSLIKELNAVQGKNKNNETLSMFNGVVPVKKEMFKILDLNSNVYVLGANPDLFDIDFLKEFNDKRIEKKIPTKIIFSIRALEEMRALDRLPFTEVRHLNYGLASYLATVIVDRFVYHLSYRDDEFVLIKIQQQDIAREQKAHFDNAWEQSRKIYS